MNNLVYIGPLWGTPETKELIGEHERFEIKHNQLCLIGDGDFLLVGGGTMQIIRRPTWTWCENPTSDMAKLWPRCEVRDVVHAKWNTRQLVAVGREFQGSRYVTRTLDGMTAMWRYCRVRLDAQGQVLVDWEGGE